MELNKKTFRKIFLCIAGAIVLYWLLHETERLGAFLGTVWSVLSPFIAGAVVAFILNVPMRGYERLLRGIQRQGLRRALAILLTLLSVILLIVGVVWLLVPQLVDTVKSLVSSIPGFFNRVQDHVKDFISENPELMTWLTENTDFASMDWSGVFKDAAAVLSNSLSAMVNGLLGVVINLSNGIFNGVMSFVFAMYCLARKEVLARQGRRILYSFLPEKAADEVVRILRMTNTIFSNFISGQCLEAVILGSMFAVAMAIFGMPYIPLVSVTISVMALVPIIGAFVGCAVGAFFILIQSPVMAFWFVIMFLVLQQIEGNLIYPRVVGTSIGLPGMWVLVAVGVGGDLLGVGGMLVMIPLSSVLYALAREITTKRLEKRGIDREKLQAHPPEGRKKRAKKPKEKRKLFAKKNKAETPEE